jgi:hypothetical protein
MSSTIRARAPALLALLALAACDDDENFVPGPSPVVPREASRAFRAIGGVSMGAYGALNIATKLDHLFGTVAALGGPVDLVELLRHMVHDNLQVAPVLGIPMQVGDDATFDHLPPYPDRDSRMRMAKDLFLALGNPFLHHPDAARAYLALDSEPARTLRDDVWGNFSTPLSPRGFADGGDANEDGLRQIGEAPAEPVDVLLAARGTAGLLAGGASGTVVGERELVDLDGDGAYDVGDGIVLNYSEPFSDLDGDLIRDPGEAFTDIGLDGVPATADFGESNGAFDYDPDRARWLAEDPTTRLAGRDADRVNDLRYYFDVGTQDLLGFDRHYQNLVAVLQGKGVEVTVQEGFEGSCTSVPEYPQRALLVRYAGGHVGIPEIDDLDEELRNGDLCSSVAVWQRLLSMIGYLSSSFADGDFGLGGSRPTGDVLTADVPSPALTPAGAAVAVRRVVVYRPPAFFNTTRSFPIVYFLGGYGQDPEDFERVGLLLDLLVATDEIQNMYFAFLPGDGGVQGSFYVDHAVPHDQVPDLPPSTGRYETSIVQDLIPFIEDELLNRRIRH